MSFLDDLIAPQQFNEHVSQGILGQIENLIWHSSLDEKEKARKMKEMMSLGSDEEAFKMVRFLSDFQPIPGHHRAAITQYEIVEATRRAVQLDDFKEEKRKK